MTYISCSRIAANSVVIVAFPFRICGLESTRPLSFRPKAKPVWGGIGLIWSTIAGENFRHYTDYSGGINGFESFHHSVLSNVLCVQSVCLYRALL